MDSHQTSPLAAQILKLVGIIMIIVALLDYLIILLPTNFSNLAWQITVTTQIVERGVIPLIAFALLFTGFWIDSLAGIFVEKPKPWLNGRFWILILSIGFGLMFLVILPYHLNNVQLNKNETLAQIDQQVNQSDQVKGQAEQRKAQIKSQVSELVKDEKKMNEYIDRLNQIKDSGQLKGEQLTSLKNELELVKKAKEDPKGFDKFVDQKIDELENQMQKKLKDDQQKAEEQANLGLWKSALQTGASSLALSIGYSLIGWLGLREMFSPKLSRRQTSLR